MFILGEDYLIFNYLLLLLSDYSIFNTSVGYIKGDHLTNTSFLVHLVMQCRCNFNYTDIYFQKHKK